MPLDIQGSANTAKRVPNVVLVDVVPYHDEVKEVVADNLKVVLGRLANTANPLHGFLNQLEVGAFVATVVDVKAFRSVHVEVIVTFLLSACGLRRRSFAVSVVVFAVLSVMV